MPQASDWVEETNEEGETIFRNQKTGETATELPESAKEAAPAPMGHAASPTVPAGAIPPWAKPRDSIAAPLAFLPLEKSLEGGTSPGSGHPYFSMKGSKPSAPADYGAVEGAKDEEGSNGIATEEDRARQRGKPSWKDLPPLMFPWFLFGMVLISTALVQGQALCFLSVSASLLLSCGFLLYSRAPPWKVLAFVCFGITLVGWAMGLYDEAKYLYPFHFYDRSPSYLSVDPNSKPGSVADAGFLQFQEGTHVDSTRGVGFVSGSLWCAAPVVMNETVTSAAYWAVGKDCCRERAWFNCGNAMGYVSRFDCLLKGWSSDCCCCFGLKVAFLMSVCAKCRQSKPIANDTWCTGCSAWEAIETELTGRWLGPKGLRAIGENLVLGAAREIRALRSLGAGLSRAPKESGAETAAAPASREAAGSARAGQGLAAKSQAKPPTAGASEYTYETETDEEEAVNEDKKKPASEEPERKREKQPEGTEDRKRSSRREKEDPPPLPRKVKEEDKEEKRRSERREEKDKRKRRESRERGEREEREGEKTEKKKKKKDKTKRGGRKHKRLDRLAEDPYARIHWHLAPEVLAGREPLEAPGDRRERKRRGFEGTVGEAALLVTSVKRLEDGSLVLGGRVVGCNVEEVGKELSNLVNRRSMPIHLCWGDPCAVIGFAEMVHTTKARWWRRQTFVAPYMKAWGKAVIKEFDEERGPPVPKRAANRGDRKKKPGTEPGIGRGKGKTEKRAGALRRPAAHGELRDKLSSLRKQLTGRKNTGPEQVVEVLDSEDSQYSEDEASEERSEEEESRREKGEEGPVTMLAIGDVKKEKTEEPARMKQKKKKKVKKRPKDAASQLLAQAAQRGVMRQKEEKSKKKEKEKRSGLGRAKELVSLLLGRREKKEKKKKGSEKRKRKKGQGGSSGGDSSPPGSSGGETDAEEGATSSDSSEMLAPLQKRSARQPGAVLKMLVQHARTALDQSSLVETNRSSDVTDGVKMATYFNLLIRPYHSMASRDMKEMNQLAVCLDELRSGDLGKLGDSLASRFLAIHTAVNEGSWRSAQFLELHPLEPTQGAPTSLLLEAKKHGKLVYRSQGSDEWRRGKGEGSGYTGPRGGEGKGKGKPWNKDRGKGNKGQGKWQGGNSWSQGGKDWWASQKEKPDSREGKPANKEGKPEKAS
eukprot:s1780_g19.t1